MLRFIALFGLLAVLTACASGNDLDEAPVPLGDFKLGHNVVVAVDPQSSVVSRKVENDFIVETMKAAMAARFGRYEGESLYHFAVSVTQYELAQPGVPVVASYRSGMVLVVTVFDGPGNKLNPEPHRIIVIESTSGKTLLGSGLTQTKEEQVVSLSRSAAKQIELWLVKRIEEDGWFQPDAEADPDSAAATTVAAGESAIIPAGTAPAGE